MDTSQLEVEAAQLVQSVKASVVQTGNGAVETTAILKKIFPNGAIVGKEQDFLSMSKVIETMFQISHAPAEKTSALWRDLALCALSGLRISN